MSARRTLFLICHAASACPAVASIEVSVFYTPAGDLRLVYRLEGRLDALRIPTPRPPEFVDGLWEHTCFEAFVAVAGEPGYREFNFSPSGQWAAYAFASYRQREDRARPETPPYIAARQSPYELEVEVSLGSALLLPPAAGATLELALSAVVEDALGGRSYWALAHASPRPDFHRRDAFLVKLAPHDDN